LKFDGQLGTWLKKIQNQWSNWKMCVNVGNKIDQIKGQIKEIGSLSVNWMSKYTNSKPIIKMKITVDFEADNWVWQ